MATATQLASACVCVGLTAALHFSCLSFVDHSLFSLIVTTTKGQVEGYSSNGVDKWRGIPYAAPPVGDLRFAVPQEAQPWSGVKSALLAGPICPQMKVLGTWSGSEDCLYADVYAPANRDLANPLPVLVWIYGGGSVANFPRGSAAVSCLATCSRDVVSARFSLCLAAGTSAMESSLVCITAITSQTSTT